MKKYFLLLASACVVASITLSAQKLVSKNIHSFGAKGDGKTNDTEAFLKAAAFFNERHGNGTLLIPKGIYIVGKQFFGAGDIKRTAYDPVDIIELKNCNNMVIKGEPATILKYCDSLKFGSFDPVTGKIFNNNNPALPDHKYAGQIGSCISLTNCKKISIQQLVMDGNNKNIIFGGRYDNQGIQLQHVGIAIKNAQRIFIQKVNASHFALDGMEIINEASADPDSINITDCTFEYNCRQGLSWVGGNFLIAKNCKFNHTGKSSYFSPPGAGVDIEAEVNSIRNGIFEHCEFINNAGCGMITGGGIVSDCTFTDCTFWGTSNWSIWATGPAFTFIGCKIYGSIVNGYNASTASEATRFIRCYFEDKAYKGTPCYGKFLLECDGPRRISFDSCTFVPHTKPLAWLNTSNAKTPEERATIKNSRFIIPKKDKDNSPVIFSTINFVNNVTEFHKY